MRLLSAISKTDLVNARLDMLRFSSVGNRLGKTTFNISGWIHAALISPAAPSSRKLSTRCSAGIKLQTDATSISLTFRQL